ncbi:MAG TPA: tetratricopeptide repeat protein [Gemmatimonadales bacterium]
MLAAAVSLVASAVFGAWQGQGPQIEATVDMDRLSVGEELTYTLRAVSHSPAPMQVTVSPFTGLELIGRSESTQLSVGDASTRTTILEIRLRAVRPGRWQVGPARAVQGSDTVEAAALVVDVAADRAAMTPSLNPRLRRLVEHATPPTAGQPGIDLLVSSDSVRVGEQVDVVTLAWFPRDLRLQLRRPPTLQPPVIDGVWSYPQATPAGIVATRSIGGRWYDLFASHQIVFPLVAGTTGIPRATLKYSLPVAMQFFSQEERYALSSRAETLVVQPLPAAGRPVGFAGAIGTGLQFDRKIIPASARVGEGIAVELSISGQGNLALWPAPDVAWPATGRAYLERVEEKVSPSEGQIGGTKTFRHLLVSDSAGVLFLPALHYAYYDLAAQRYLEIGAPATSIPVVRAGESAATAALPPALLRRESPALAWQLGHAIPDWVWILVLVTPPLIAGLRGRTAVRLRRRAVAPQTSDLRGVEHDLDAILGALVPEAERGSSGALVAALRAAGADAELAARVSSVRERLLARRYGPAAKAGEDAKLTAEVREIVRLLGGTVKAWRVPGAAAIALLLLSLALPALSAQTPAPEQMYESGSLRAASDAFRQRAEAEPAVAAHWYNLGAAYFRMGLKGQAAAAWLEARRLAPREPSVRRALELTPPADLTSSRWTWSPPVTPEELLLLGTLAWVLAWAGWAMRPRARDRWTILLVFAGCAALAGLGLRVWYRRPIGVVVDTSTLRLSPHGLAPAIAPVDGGSAVLLLRSSPGWVLVRASGDREGWLPKDAVAPVGG